MCKKREMKRLFLCVVSLVFAVLLSGCATNRGLISLKMPEQGSILKLNGKKIFVSSVEDNREFQENPPEANIPSIGFGGASAASEDLKKRAIARKRNTYGKALGDILLEEGQTVESLIHDILARAFLELGYEVVENNEGANSDSIIVDVSIEKFWSWFSPGFWAIRLNSEIETKITAARVDASDKKEIYVIFEKKFQAASEKNWKKVMQGGLDLYKEKVKTEFSNNID